MSNLLEVKGQIVSQPVVVRNDREAIVMLVVKTDNGYEELYCKRIISSICGGLDKNFVKTRFSLIALSAVGDSVEAKMWHNSGEIYEFKNITQGRMR